MRPLLEAAEGRLLMSGAAASMTVSPLVVRVGPAMASPEISPGRVASPSAPGCYVPAQFQQAYGFNQVSFNNGSHGERQRPDDRHRRCLQRPDIAGTCKPSTRSSACRPPELLRWCAIRQQHPAGARIRPGTGRRRRRLDVEWAHAMAPGANILLVEANTTSSARPVHGGRVRRRPAGRLGRVDELGLEPSSAGENSMTAVHDAQRPQPRDLRGGLRRQRGPSPIRPPRPTSWASAAPTSRSMPSNNISSETAWSGSGGGISAVRETAQLPGLRGTQRHDHARQP